MINNSEQLSLINEQPKADNATVVCLGMTFENEEARRAYFREELRKKLPKLKQIEGNLKDKTVFLDKLDFNIGEIYDINLQKNFTLLSQASFNLESFDGNFNFDNILAYF